MNIPFRLALLLAALLGFIALAYEIVWARIYGFVSGSRPQAFGAMLGFYLLGLAIGALLSRRWQNCTGQARLVWLARLVVVSNVACFLLGPAAAHLIVHTTWVRLLPLALVGSALMGTLLPLLCHYAIAADEQAGARMSYVYLANIIGSGAGSLLTGFVFLDVMKLWQLAGLLLAAAAVLAFALAHRSGRAGVLDCALVGAAMALACTSAWLHDSFYERLQFAGDYKPGMRFAQVVESRHGVITIATDRKVYGNGVYDGIIETDPKAGQALVRPYFISAVHAAPREVLVIGMSAGAWTQILANNPQVERVTVVEISAAYLEVAASWPQVSSVLKNPKVNIIIDDGRRWLRRNPTRHFDVIVMNTTFHWREFASALLSREFLTITRTHLNAGGVVMWNTTDSSRAALTGMEIFPHTMMVHNNIIGSVTPLRVDKERWREVLSAYRIDGRPVFDLATEEGRSELSAVLALGADAPAAHPRFRLMDRPEMEKRFGSAPAITDNNLGNEYSTRYDAFLASLVPGMKTLLYPRVN